jgi:hypothetical protein
LHDGQGEVSKKIRPRTQQRQDARKARELVRDREKLASLERGGAPDRPITVESPAVVELRAEESPCIQCQGRMRVLAHRAETVEGELLRLVETRCLVCGTARNLWFKIAPPLAN